MLQNSSSVAKWNFFPIVIVNVNVSAVGAKENILKKSKAGGGLLNYGLRAQNFIGLTLSFFT